LRTADICLVLEGTYPFVSGGVSSWVHHLTTNLKHLNFTILHISPKRGYFKKHAYQMPPNIIGLEEVFLHDYAMEAGGKEEADAQKVLRFRSLVNDMLEGKGGAFQAFVRVLRTGTGERFTAADLLQTPGSWQVLVDAYRREAGDESFLNFFWTWRFSFLPLFNLLSAAVPPARVYHTISTGYAGLFAAAARLLTSSSMLLTEHGIYTKERRIEVNRAEWIADWSSGEVVAERKPPYFKRYWIRQFEMMSRVTYAHCDEILTLFTGNTYEQIRDGANPRIIRVIPNGVDVERYGVAAARFDQRAPNERFTVGFIGRVCPIKDVQTFVSAMRLVADRIPDVRVRILGPMDEDPEYAERCKRHVERLGLSGNVNFEGRVNVLEELPTLDVVVLTSISEAQPLVILEAGGVGVPVVATDVGSCSELLFGQSPEDRAIGAGGVITPMASPGETARAVLSLHDDPDARLAMGRTLRERVRRFYDQKDMVRAYDELYRKHLEREAVTT